MTAKHVAATSIENGAARCDARHHLTGQQCSGSTAHAGPHYLKFLNEDVAELVPFTRTLTVAASS